MHERISTPSRSTEHEPHWASPQPKRGPCRPSSFDSTYSSGVSRSAATVDSCSFTRILSSSAISSSTIFIFLVPTVARKRTTLQSALIRELVGYPPLPGPGKNRLHHEGAAPARLSNWRLAVLAAHHEGLVGTIIDPVASSAQPSRAKLG